MSCVRNDKLGNVYGPCAAHTCTLSLRDALRLRYGLPAAHTIYATFQHMVKFLVEVWAARGPYLYATLYHMVKSQGGTPKHLHSPPETLGLPPRGD